jgi:ComF family protein
VTRYENAFRDLIHTFKYRKGVWLTEDLGRYLLATYLERIQGAGIEIDIIVPVPMQPSKHRTRGYNQTDLLANYLAKHLDIPVKKNLLKRVKTGIISQTRLHRGERFQNAKRAYRLKRHVNLTNLNVLLVDDVVTTGATCKACAELLRTVGAKNVYVLALARPLNP